MGIEMVGRVDMDEGWKEGGERKKAVLSQQIGITAHVTRVYRYCLSSFFESYRRARCALRSRVRARSSRTGRSFVRGALSGLAFRCSAIFSSLPPPVLLLFRRENGFVATLSLYLSLLSRVRAVNERIEAFLSIKLTEEA